MSSLLAPRAAFLITTLLHALGTTYSFRPIRAVRSLSTRLHSSDAYVYLEDVLSPSSLAFAKRQNDSTIKILGDPNKSDTKTKVKNILDSKEKIKYAYLVGKSNVYNYWQDESNPRGIWRRQPFSKYTNGGATSKEGKDWETVIDLDEVNKKEGKSWVWKGSRYLPLARDPTNSGDVGRAMLMLSPGGSDAVVVREYDLNSKSFVPKSENPFVVKEGKTRVTYLDRDTVIVGACDVEPGDVTDSGYPRTVRIWKRGTPIEDAEMVYEGEKTDVAVSGYIDDQRKRGGNMWMCWQRSITFYTGEYRVKDLEGSGSTFKLNVQEDADVSFFGPLIVVELRSEWSRGGVTYKKGSLITTDAKGFVEEGKEDWKVLFEPSDNTSLGGHCYTKSKVILSTMVDVKSKVVFKEWIGADWKVTNQDKGSGTCNAISIYPVDGENSDEVWCTTSGYNKPSTLSLASADMGMGEEYIKSDIASLPDLYDKEGVEVKQGFAKSRDGTKVPYFIVTPKDMSDKGDTPTLLYGYGGFEVSLTPRYSATVGKTWLERGGCYVQANIRGGGEYGPSWHQSALKGKRQNAYDDFIAVAEHLIKTGVCKKDTLACSGGSNGGLLVGMMLVQRPDLWGAIHCAVPLLDMKRYHKLLAGASWMAEYGDPDIKEEWEGWIKNISPYHLLDASKTYPPTLFTTSTRDDRVHPAHARKMVAKMEKLGGGNWPIYYYENMEGGHGGAADADQMSYMMALEYDFMFNTLKKNA